MYKTEVTVMGEEALFTSQVRFIIQKIFLCVLMFFFQSNILWILVAGVRI